MTSRTKCLSHVAINGSITTHFVSKMIVFGDLSLLFFPKMKDFGGALGICLDYFVSLRPTITAIKGHSLWTSIS